MPDVSDIQWVLGDVVASEVVVGAEPRARARASGSAQPPPQSVAFVFVLDGTVQVTVGGAVFVLVAGSAAVLPGDHIPDFCSEASRLLLVSVAGRSAQQFTGLVPAQLSSLSAAVVRTHPVLPFVLALTQNAKRQAIEIRPAADVITKLLVSLLRADQEWQSRPEHPLVTKALTLISEHHTEADFDGRALARQMKMTVRDLEVMLTFEHGGRLARELILERRLITAMTLLHPETGLAPQVVAGRSGFRTVGELRAGLEAAYGIDIGQLSGSSRAASSSL